MDIVFILDRSGSMSGLENDVIGGFNKYVGEQKKLGLKAKLTTVLFDNVYEVLHDRIPISEVPKLTKFEYFPRGTTALLDAVGKSINVTKSKTKKGDKVLFIINTDGYENSSKEFTKEQIKKLVTKMVKDKDWKFVYYGADLDNFSDAQAMGINIVFAYDKANTSNFYNAVSRGTAAYACASPGDLSGFDDNVFKVAEDDPNLLKPTRSTDVKKADPLL